MSIFGFHMAQPLYFAACITLLAICLGVFVFGVNHLIRTARGTLRYRVAIAPRVGDGVWLPDWHSYTRVEVTRVDTAADGTIWRIVARCYSDAAVFSATGMPVGETRPFRPGQWWAIVRDAVRVASPARTQQAPGV